MKIPDKIRIGKYNYNIKKVRIIDWTNSNIDGQISYSSKMMKIKINKKDERITESTFFHEIVHGILKELEYNYPKISSFRSNESFVQELALILRKTFIDLLDAQEK